MSDSQYIGPSLKKEKHDEMIRREVLLAGEEIEAAIWGNIEASVIPLDAQRNKNQSLDLATKAIGLDKRSGILGLTNQRIIFYMPKMMNRYEFEAYPIKQVDSVQFTKGMRKGRIDISIVNNNRVIKAIQNDEGKIIVDRIQEAVQKAGKAEGATIVTSHQDPVDALKMKFVNGEITKEEFEEKRKILEG